MSLPSIPSCDPEHVISDEISSLASDAGPLRAKVMSGPTTRQEIGVRTHRIDLAQAVSRAGACQSGYSCIREGKCLDNPMCQPRLPIGRNAGFVAATPSSRECGYCTSSFGGDICFCPVRWALVRIPPGETQSTAL